MIGFYDYTVILTYLSLTSSGIGIMISLSGKGHPYFGVFFLLFCGLCDAFDGKVARTKKNRSDMEKNFGIQIDSLSDVIAFGVLPACIGAAMIRTSPFLINTLKINCGIWYGTLIRFLLFSILILYILAALIRLAYFNVTEEERQKKESCARTEYTGLPVTSAALIFPMVLLLQYIIPADITLLYILAVLFTGIAFVSKFHIKKPELKGILIMVAIGVIEFILLIISKKFLHK
ncbi:MAG: CDP-alcohol phosphatidyltransferase family protein [Lachnospiraceae bacterium]|nr:CDP-alcohol phosphatidyltransferase family protein [Lachnospiraceae bacterium]